MYILYLLPTAYTIHLFDSQLTTIVNQTIQRFVIFTQTKTKFNEWSEFKYCKFCKWMVKYPLLSNIMCREHTNHVVCARYPVKVIAKTANCVRMWTWSTPHRHFYPVAEIRADTNLSKTAVEVFYNECATHSRRRSGNHCFRFLPKCVLLHFCFL